MREVMMRVFMCVFGFGLWFREKASESLRLHISRPAPMVFSLK
jgi:hypothetical protein